MFEYVWICNMFEYVWICLNMFEYVWICLNMFEYVWICLNVVSCAFHVCIAHFALHIADVRAWSHKVPSDSRSRPRVSKTFGTKTSFPEQCAQCKQCEFWNHVSTVCSYMFLPKSQGKFLKVLKAFGFAGILPSSCTWAQVSECMLCNANLHHFSSRPILTAASRSPPVQSTSDCFGLCHSLSHVIYVAILCFETRYANDPKCT